MSLNFKGENELWHTTPSPVYGYIPYLDGLRAIAVLIVLGRHLGFSDYFPGGFGVTIFFFLSGFLITRLLLIEMESSSGIKLKNFYIRRFFRLSPALFTMILFSWLALTFLFKVEVPYQNLSASLLYYMNYYLVFLKASGQELAFGGWTVLWSLAVEEHFYFLFPLLLLLKGRGVIRAVALVIIVSLIIRIIDWNLLSNTQYYVYLASETRMDSILWGCLLSLCLVTEKGRLFIEKYFFSAWWLWGSIIGLLVIFLIRSDMFQSTVKFSLQGALLFIVFIQIIFTHHHSRIKSFLEWSFMRWTGKISYSLYLWHISCFYIITEGFAFSGLLASLISLVLSFLVAQLSYRYIEVPAVNFRKRFGAHVNT